MVSSSKLRSQSLLTVLISARNAANVVPQRASSDPINAQQIEGTSNSRLPVTLDDLSPSSVVSASLPSALALDEELIHRLVQTYMEHVHNQPMPLFEPNELIPSIIRAWPKHLLLSFAALTARFSSNVLTEQERRQYQRQARHEVLSRLTDKESSTEVLQSLCFLILGAIAGKFCLSAVQ